MSDFEPLREPVDYGGQTFLVLEETGEDALWLARHPQMRSGGSQLLSGILQLMRVTRRFDADGKARRLSEEEFERLPRRCMIVLQNAYARLNYAVDPAANKAQAARVLLDVADDLPESVREYLEDLLPNEAETRPLAPKPAIEPSETSSESSART